MTSSLHPSPRLIKRAKNVAKLQLITSSLHPSQRLIMRAEAGRKSIADDFVTASLETADHAGRKASQSYDP